MKRGIFVVLAILLAISLFSAPAMARHGTDYPVLNEKIGSHGEYIVYVLQGDEWKKAGSLGFDRFFRTREIDLRGYSTTDNLLRIRLVQRGGGAAHIDDLSLGGMPPVEVKGIDPNLALKKLSKRDFDVVDAFNKDAELAFRNSGKDTVLSITARVEPEIISKVPFQFPVENLFQHIDGNSRFYTYRLDSNTNDPAGEPAPFFKEYCRTGSGHPSGYTYGWVRNDDKNLYVTIDFTPDNTMDGDKDYAKVYAKTEAGIKEFKVSVPDTIWGDPGFTYTSRAPYQHKVYAFKIPFKKLGIKDGHEAKELHLAFSAYGTAAPIPPPGTYYVDISQTAEGDGSEANPWKTLHFAIGQINLYERNGNTDPYILDVAPGEYSESNGEANTDLYIDQDNVTVIGYYTNKPVLIGHAGTQSPTPQERQYETWEIGIVITGSNIVIRDLEIKNFYGGIEVWGDSATIYNCAVHDNTSAGITIGYEGTIAGGAIKRCEVYNNGTGIGIWDVQNIVVEQNYVRDNTFGYNGYNGYSGIDILYSSGVVKKNQIENDGAGIYIHECSPRVERNEIKDNETGIALSGSASPEIYNNLIYDTASAMYDGIMVDAWYASAAPFIYHNTIDKGMSHGIYMYGGYMGSCNPDILFNIITNSGTYGIFNGEYLGEYCDPSIDYNDVWHNGPDPYDQNYSGCSAGSNDISSDPRFASYELQSESPCKNAIPTEASDPVTIDLPGYERPREGGSDMGAYEYVLDITHNYNLPGGTSPNKIEDYRMFTIPVYAGAGATMKTTMENTSGIGAYDPCRWRVFAYGSSYIEMNDAGFLSLPVGPGDAFWAISIDELAAPTSQFEGRPAPDGEYYTMPLKVGWNMFGLPWPTGTDPIEVGWIVASDGVNNYWITSPDNTLTQQCVWDYTGSYVEATALVPGNGYWIKVVTSRVPVELLIPRDNTENDFYGITIKSIAGKNTIRSSSNYEQPPPPPGGISTGSSGIQITEKGGCFISAAAE